VDHYDDWMRASSARQEQLSALRAVRYAVAVRTPWRNHVDR
jgi:hypothetical protein